MSPKLMDTRCEGFTVIIGVNDSLEESKRLQGDLSDTMGSYSWWST